METTKILTTDFLDILFDGRNKSYGAYELRTNYNTRILKALGITCILCAGIAGAVYWKSLSAVSNADTIVRISPDLTITKIDDRPIEKPPLPEVPKQQEIKKVATIKYVIPKIVADNEVVKAPPAQKDLTDIKIGLDNIKGDKVGDIVVPVTGYNDQKGILMGSQTKADEEERPFERVEVDALYPGGNSAWRSFLERNLRGEGPVEKGAQPGVYKVIIKFVVDKQGVVSDLVPLTHFGFGMEEEAMRVIKKSGKWKPAIQNGREVKAYRQQPVTFQVLEQ